MVIVIARAMNSTGSCVASGHQRDASQHHAVASHLLHHQHGCTLAPASFTVNHAPCHEKNSTIPKKQEMFNDASKKRRTGV
jgi:hypothetical protein